ncbi:MAG: serine/threonine-protein kinase [Deltaproteobacteria bacterium]|nr:serine/threonine-protein kinase [Deltaproteobacteria bacterium]
MSDDAPATLRSDALAPPLRGGDDARGPGVPTRVGRYLIDAEIGAGAMGVVYRARDPELDRVLAIKVIRARRGDSRARLLREAQAMARIHHPNVVPIFDVGTFDGQIADARTPDDAGLFVVMPLVAGGTLRAWMRRGPHPWREVVARFIAAGRGLSAAHAAGLVHRDFKPDNVLVSDDGQVVVADFGLALAHDVPPAAEHATSPGLETSTIAGTPAYMAPEQRVGAPLDARTDQFAFCIAFWEGLYGERPGDARTRTRVRAPLAKRSALRADGDAPAWLRAALERGLAADPARRWPSLAALLEHILARLKRPRQLALAAAATAVLATTAMIAWQRTPPDATCRTAGDAIDEVWSPARRRALATAFAARSEPGAAAVWTEVDHALDRWTGQLRALRVEDCQLARTDAGAQASAREACLDARVTELDALLIALATPDATVVQYARAAALALPPPDGCRTVAPDAAVLVGRPSHDELDRARAGLARAAALRRLGKPRDAVAAATAVATRADSLGWSPLIAEAQLELGLADQATNDNDAGERAHQRAYWHADASRDDALRFQATLGLERAAIDLSEFDLADRLIESARMIARRLPSDTSRDLAIATRAADLASWRGHDSECVALAQTAIEAIDRATGVNSIDGANMRALLAQCLSNVGRIAESGEPLQQALAIALATVGREHPMTAEILSNLGSLAREQGRPEEALTNFHESLAIRERIFGPDNPAVAMSLNTMGDALRQLHRYDEARTHLARALVIWERNWGPQSPAIATVSCALGEVEMDQGHPAAAEALFRRALAIRRVKRPAGHPEIDETLVKLARALLAQHDRACLPLLEEAMTGYTARKDADPAERGIAQLTLGRALLEFGGDRARGLALIAAAGPESVGADPDVR